MPVLSNWNIGLKGNMGLKSFLHPHPNGNGLVTFLHPDISSEVALKQFHNNNKMLMDMNLDILSFGFRGMGGYNTVTLGVRVNYGFNMPKEYFEFTKSLENKDYNFSNTNTKTAAWAELALGHSHQITEAWRIGAKAKILLGAAYANVNLDNVHMDLRGENEWTANANATAEVGIKGFTWGETERKEYNNQYPGHEYYEQINFDNVDVESPGLNGGGFALDLGTEWDLGKQGLVEGLKLSASLLDLGFIKWKNIALAQNRGEEFVFNGFNDIKVEDGDGTDFEDQTDDLGDRLSDLYSLQDGGTTSSAKALGTTLNIAAEYALPCYDKLSFGFLSTTRIQGVYSWNEERISATISPAKCFEVSGNVAFGTFGTNVGWLINFHPRGFNLFLGSDHCVGKFSKQGIPLRSSYDVNFGIAFPIGKSKIGKKEI